jgi:hypothetical protein
MTNYISYNILVVLESISVVKVVVVSISVDSVVETSASRS